MLHEGLYRVRPVPSFVPLRPAQRMRDGKHAAALALKRLVVLSASAAWLCAVALTNGLGWFELASSALHLLIEVGLARDLKEVRQVWDDVTTPPKHGTSFEKLCMHLNRLNNYAFMYSGRVVLAVIYVPVQAVRTLAFALWHAPLEHTVFHAAVLLGGSNLFCGLSNISAHRYFAHRSFRTSRPAQFVLGLAAAASGQNGPLWWSSQHVEHHRHCDAENDPHSPGRAALSCGPFGRIFGALYAHVLWMTRRDHLEIKWENAMQFRRYPEVCSALSSALRMPPSQ